MSHHFPFQIKNFEGLCNTLERVGVDPGFVLYTNQHASNEQPMTRLIYAHQLEAAENYLNSPTDEHFRQLVKLGVLFDNEWDRNTASWAIISFKGWEALHTAFCHLHSHNSQSLLELTGLSSDDFLEVG